MASTNSTYADSRWPSQSRTGRPTSSPIVRMMSGTVAAALGLGLQLWTAGLVFWIVGHGAAVTAAKKDPRFMDVLLRHVRHRNHLAC